MSEPPKKKLYFDDKVQQAIVEYINQSDYNRRNEIYNNHIHRVFQVLVVNIMHKRRVYYATDDYDIVKNDAMGFIVTKLDKYKPLKGRAFSYFTVIMQRYMQTVVDKGIKNRKRFRSIDYIYQNRQISKYEEMVNSSHNHQLREQNIGTLLYKKTVEDLIELLTSSPQCISRKCKDKKIVEAVLNLLRDCNNIQRIHKKAIYLYIREMTNQNSISISRVLKKINKHYLQIYNYNKNNELFMSLCEGEQYNVG